MAEEKKDSKNNVANNQNATSFRGKKNSANQTEDNRLLYDPEYRQHNFLNSNITREDDEEQEESSEEEEKETEEKQDEQQATNSEEQKPQENVSNARPKVNNREKLRVKGNSKMNKADFILKFHKYKIIIIIASIILVLFMILILFGAIGDAEESDNSNSFCSSGTGGNLLSFLEAWEGNEGYCEVNGEKGYTAKNLGDGAITLGSGFTNLAMDADVISYIHSNGWAAYFLGNTVTVGMCVPISVFERVQLFAIERTYAKAIDDAANKYNVVLTQYQKDALTDFNYNQGTAYSDRLLSAYASGGYSGLWNEMKIHTKGGMAGIMKRLKAEFALFVTGDYSDQNLFYSRSIGNFDDYNSEKVMSRMLNCRTSSNGFIMPLEDNTYRCSSSFGPRKPPTQGASSNHGGIDLGASCGIPVHAAQDGTISIRRSDSTGGGNWIQIEHGNGMATRYLHMSRFASYGEGSKVRQGDVIGYVGTTGTSTGCHLDFRILVNGTAVNPMDYIKDIIKPFDNNFYKCNHNY